MEKVQPFKEKLIEKIIELRSLSPDDQTKKLREILSKTRIPLWIFGIVGSGALLRFYLKRKWSYWKEKGINGPEPSIGKFGNGTDFMDIQRGTMSPEEWVEKYGKVSGGYFGLNPFMIIRRVLNISQITLRSDWPDLFTNENLDK